MSDHTKRIKNILEIKAILDTLQITDKTFNLIWLTDHEVAKLLDELKELKGGADGRKKEEN